MTLLERHSLLQRLDRLLARAEQGGGRLVCLSGEAGAGKSTLANALAANARGRVRVLWGACEDLSTPEPLAPLHDLARSGGWPVFAEGSRTPVSLFNDVLGRLMAEPTLAVLEDLHWADDATLDFVRFMGRRIRDTPIMLLATARDDASDAQMRLRRALVDVPPDICTRIDIPLLSESAVRELARDCGQDGAKVFALTDGNPFLVMEILRSGQDCPTTVRDALLARSERLSPGARTALKAASIFPRRVEAGTLQGLGRPIAADHLAECVAAGILIAEEGYYSFRHEIARRAIEESIAPSTRTELNRTALAVLQGQTSVATARLVHHAIEAGDAEAVCRFAPRAADEAARVGAHRQAAQHYAAALSHSATLPPERRAELHEGSGLELQLIGRVPEAIEALKEALSLRQQCGDELAAGDILRRLGPLHYNIGEQTDALAYATKSIAVLEPLGPVPELAMAYANLALFKSLVNDHVEAIAWAEKAIDLGSKLKRLDILADTYSALGVAMEWVDTEASRANYARGLELSLKLGRDGAIARTYTNAACMELNARENARARDLLRSGLAYCSERDLEGWVAYKNGWLAELMVREGQWDEARALAERTVERPFLTRVMRFSSALSLARLRIRTGVGDVPSLVAHLTFGSEPQRLLLYAPVLAERAWVQDCDHDEALAILEHAAEVATRVGNVWAAGEIAYWRTKLGGAHSIPARVALPYRLQLQGDWQGAAAAWAKVPAPYDQALALLEGDDEARHEGLIILERLGARAVAERARALFRRGGLRGIARGPRASTRANAAGLTKRQMQILSLIDRGLTNGEIASKLSLSTRTIDHHVSAILAKLQVTTRAEASARARDAGLIRS
jgi:DNA-binding CsgD family transcriptional regulator